MKKQTLISIGLFIIALALRLYMIQLDPFLNDWDERFHALVARNLSQNPFLPLLNQQHIHSFFIDAWDHNQVWLHKQPLFMWQMALSIKMFGINEVAVRLPSAIMGALAAVLVYRIAYISFSKNTKVAIGAALLWSFSYYQLELTSGHLGMEHNDVAFSFYILCSVWAYYEFISKKSWAWAVTIGFFVGCAILNKWLTGILVFAPWGLYVIHDFYKNKKSEELKYLLLSLLTAVAVFMPWQIYIMTHFPAEAAHEYLLNRKHLTIAVEGHRGEWNYYLSHFNQYFGKFIVYLLPVGILLAFRKLNRFHFSNIFMSVFVFTFFSFIAVTKIPSFFFIVVPFLLIYLSFGFFKVLSILRLQKMYWIMMLPLLWFSLRPIEIINIHSDSGYGFTRKKQNTIVYKKLAKEITTDVHFLGFQTRDNIEMMFYNPHVLSCAYYENFNSAIKYLERGYNIVMFAQHLKPTEIEQLKQYPNFRLIEYKIEQLY